MVRLELEDLRRSRIVNSTTAVAAAALQSVNFNTENLHGEIYAK